MVINVKLCIINDMLNVKLLLASLIIINDYDMLKTWLLIIKLLLTWFLMIKLLLTWLLIVDMVGYC